MPGYPTILVAGLGHSELAESLRRDGYLVLEADDREHVLETIKRHSRPIHLLLGACAMETDAVLLQKHRPALLFYFVSRAYDEGAVLAAVKELVAPPRRAPAPALTKSFVKAS